MTTLETQSAVSASLDQQGTRNSTLSTKITSILSASYADIEIRDALETLDARHVQNTADTRRNLRRDVQKETIDANAEIVQDFGQVATQLKSVGGALHSLQQTVASIRQHVTYARTETKPLLEEAGTLVAQRSQIETKQRVLNSFNSHFLLNDDELKTLTSSGEPVNDTFFAVLVKAKRIHQDSQHLLGGESQRLGLEILDQSSRNLNSAFQKLYRFLQREFRSLDLENPRITISIRRALRVLAERPTLFQNCLDTFAESRERNLSDAFYAALTGSNHYGGDHQKPIDFSAHEPLRYVGDMLAWAHSTAVSEREALEGLFVSEGDEIARGINEGLESEPWSRMEAANRDSVNEEVLEPADAKPDTFDGRRALSQLINRSLAGVAHLLSQRISTVLFGHEDPVLHYKTANLLVFYRDIFSRLVNQSGFLSTLSQIESQALSRFKETTSASIAALKADIDNEGDAAVPADLSPPDWLATALEDLTALFKSYETSQASNLKAPSDSPLEPSSSSSAEIPNPENNEVDEAEEAEENTLPTLLNTALAPCMNLLTTLSGSLPSAMTSHIFLHNSLTLILPTLQAYAYLTAPKIAELQSELDTHTTALLSDTHAFLLTTSGLAPLVTAATAMSSSTSPTAKAEAEAAFHPDNLAAVSAQLDAFLPSAVTDAESRLGFLRDKQIVERIVREAGERFVVDFIKVEDVVGGIEEKMAAEREPKRDEEDEEEEGLRGVFPRTAEEVRVLLS